MPERVVWLTALPPHHEGTGGQRRQAHLLDAVAARAAVVLVCAGRADDATVRASVADVVETASPASLPAAGPRLRGRLLTHWALARTPLPTAAARETRRSLRAAAADVLGPQDVLVLEHLELAPLVAHLPACARSVLTIHHAAAHQARQELKLATTARQRSWWRREQARSRRLERWAGQHVDTVVTVSPLDAAAVACDSVVVPNGTVIPDVPPSPAPGDHVVSFSGDLAYGPNVDGATWFVEHAWPAIRDAVPDATLQLVGRAPAPAVRALASRPGVEVHADVPTIGPYVAASDCVVVPLRLGGGTRLKALQAMAAGRPVVGTSIGLEGLDVLDGQQARIADAPSALAAAVVDVLHDPAEAAALAARAHAWVAVHHDWRRIGRLFAEEVLGL